MVEATDRDLENAGVSFRDYNKIKLLLSIDKELMKPNTEFTSLSRQNMMVDLSKYENLSKDAKEILYRPPKLHAL